MAMAKEMTVPTMIPRALDVPTMMAQVVEKPGEPTTMTKILDVLKTTAMALDAPTTMAQVVEKLDAPTTTSWAVEVAVMKARVTEMAALTKIQALLKTVVEEMCVPTKEQAVGKPSAPMMTAEGLDALTTMVPMGEDIQAKTELNAPTTKGWATGKLSVLTRKSQVGARQDELTMRPADQACHRRRKKQYRSWSW